MRSLAVLIAILLPFSSFAGIGGGGTGPRPTQFMQQTDLVKTLTADDEEVTFLYKAFDQQAVSTQTVPVNEINRAFLTALSKSRSSKSWAPVKFEE